MRPVMRDEKRAGHLLANTQQEEHRYFNKYRYFSIMHILVTRKQLAEREACLPDGLMSAYGQA